MRFKALPVTDFTDVTLDLEQLATRAILDKTPTNFLQLLTAQKLQLNFGNAGTLAAGAQTTVSHGLPGTPQVVIATNLWTDNTSSAFYTVFGLTATQFTVINKGTTNGQPVWIAFG